MKRYLSGGTVIDGTGGAPLVGGCVVLEDGLIVGVGPAASFEPEPEAEVVDTTRRTMLPGLFNCHGHLAWDSRSSLKEQSLHDPPETAAFKCARSMRWCLEAGVTTFRDLGVHLTGVRAREARDAGIVAGPRVLASGAAVTQTGGHTYWCGVEADGADAVRRAVRQQLRAGVDLIKIMASGGSGEPGEVADLPEFTLEELRAASDEAHRANKPITAHATGTEAARNIADAGFDCCEHGAPFDDYTIEVMVERGMAVVPTLTPLFIQAERGLEGGMHSSLVDRRKRQIEDHQRFDAIARAVRAGVRLGLGTDAGSPMVPHNLIAYEMQCLVRLGIAASAMDAIVAATQGAAEVCRVADQLGTLEPGKVADVVLIDGDPLADLDAVGRVCAVWQGGELVT